MTVHFNKQLVSVKNCRTINHALYFQLRPLSSINYKENFLCVLVLNLV